MFLNPITCMHQTVTLTKRRDSRDILYEDRAYLSARYNDVRSLLKGLRASKWHVGRYDLYYDEILDIRGVSNLQFAPRHFARRIDD